MKKMPEDNAVPLQMISRCTYPANWTFYMHAKPLKASVSTTFSSRVSLSCLWMLVDSVHSDKSGINVLLGLHPFSSWPHLPSLIRS